LNEDNTAVTGYINQANSVNNKYNVSRAAIIGDIQRGLKCDNTSHASTPCFVEDSTHYRYNMADLNDHVTMLVRRFYVLSLHELILP
jgi:hypothetical protein